MQTETDIYTAECQRKNSEHETVRNARGLGITLHIKQSFNHSVNEFYWHRLETWSRYGLDILNNISDPADYCFVLF